MVKLRPVPSARQAERAQEEAAASATPPESSSANIRGLIDNATPDRLYGWAWDASNPEHRLRVELRLAGETVASTVADTLRPDLAGNGVGDGRHAFEFELSKDWIERRAELAVVAIGQDGSEYPISVRFHRPDASRAMVQLQLTLNDLRAERQRLRAEFAELRERVERLPEPAAIEEIARVGQEAQQRLDALELWISRLDSRLGEVTTPRDAGPGTRLDPWQAVLLAVLASVASTALALAAAHFLA